MSRSKTLSRALRALAHPVTPAWVLVLLVNDQWLRWAHPSRLTGKLSDVAWLAVAPLVVAVPFSLWLSRGPDRVSTADDRRPIGAAIAFVGVIFAVIKAIPAATDAFRPAFRAVFGWTPLIVTDATDLLTLPALALAWWVWGEAKPQIANLKSRATIAGEGTPRAAAAFVETTRRVVCRVTHKGMDAHEKLSPPYKGRRVTDTSLQNGRTPPDARATIRRGWAVLALAALATLGNSGPPNEGILCVNAAEGRIIAGPRHDYAYTEQFVSEDGGLSWRSLGEPSYLGDTRFCEGHSGPWTLDGPAENEQLRFVPGERIERSTDGGATWTTALSLRGADARQAYYQMTRSNTWGDAGPHDAVVDPETGNVIVAMGHEGVLVRTAPEAWQWVALGEYGYEPLRTVGQALTLLQAELGLAVAAGFVTVILAGWRFYGTLPRGTWVLRVLAVLVALGVALIPVIVRPATVTSYATMISFGAVIGALGVTLILGAIAAFLQARGAPRRLWGLAGWWVLTAVAFILPYIAWTVGWLASYTPAAWATVIVTVVIWVAAVSDQALNSTTSPSWSTWSRETDCPS